MYSNTDNAITLTRDVSNTIVVDKVIQQDTIGTDTLLYREDTKCINQSYTGRKICSNYVGQKVKQIYSKYNKYIPTATV